jgi:hypothetical protein
LIFICNALPLKKIFIQVQIRTSFSTLFSTLAANVRFGATAAVTPLKVQCGHDRQYPAESSVKPPLRQAARCRLAFL